MSEETTLEQARAEFTHERGRAAMQSLIDDFADDDALHEEQDDLREALADPDFPRTAEEYCATCMRIVWWIPRLAKAVPARDALLDGVLMRCV